MPFCNGKKITVPLCIDYRHTNLIIAKVKVFSNLLRWTDGRMTESGRRSVPDSIGLIIWFKN